MCYSNSPESKLSCNEWQKMFPHGVPDVYIDGDYQINIKELLPCIRKESIPEFILWANRKGRSDLVLTLDGTAPNQEK